MDEIIGTHTHVLKFEDFYQPDYIEMRKSLESELSDLVHKNKLPLSEYDKETILGRNLSCNLSNNFGKCNYDANLGFATQIKNQYFNLKAHNYDPEDYISPSLNLIQINKASVTGLDFTEQSLGARIPFAMGKNKEMRLQVLLHEIGHGTGACEPQTEAIAAVLYSQLVEDNTFLSECADMRILNTVLRFDDEIGGGILLIDKFGLPMCEVNDYIRTLPRQDIDDINLSTLLNLRFNNFDHQHYPVIRAGTILKAKAPEAFEKRNLKELSLAADDVLQRQVLSQETTRIMSRFMLAAERIRQAGEENPIIDQNLLQVEQEDPISFSKARFFEGTNMPRQSTISEQAETLEP